MEYTVIVHEAEEGGYWVQVPVLAGCFSQAESVDEALKNAAHAVRSHIKALKEDGQEIPKERGFFLGRVSVPV